MMGIIGMMIHEALTGNPLFPLQPEASLEEYDLNLSQVLSIHHLGIFTR